MERWEKRNRCSVSFSYIFFQAMLSALEFPAGFQKLRFLNMRNANDSFCHRFIDGENESQHNDVCCTQIHRGTPTPKLTLW